MGSTLHAMTQALPTAADLVRAAMLAVGAENQVDFVYELRRQHGIRVGQSQISRWKNGRGMSYDNVLDLLNLVGWLTVPADALAAIAAEESAADPKPVGTAEVRELLPDLAKKSRRERRARGAENGKENQG
jgi:transcriptional regulator with XRE-family HTH domain